MFLKNIYNSIKYKLMPNQLIETSFLIPLTEDKVIGDGKLHPSSRWLELKNKLFKTFKGYTVSSGFYGGCWERPDTRKPVYDTSKKYFVALRPKDLKKIRVFLKTVAFIFRQEEIYFVINGKVEFIENDRHKKIQNTL